MVDPLDTDMLQLRLEYNLGEGWVTPRQLEDTATPSEAAQLLDVHTAAAGARGGASLDALLARLRLVASEPAAQRAKARIGKGMMGYQQACAYVQDLLDDRVAFLRTRCGQ